MPIVYCICNKKITVFIFKLILDYLKEKTENKILLEIKQFTLYFCPKQPLMYIL